MQESSDLIVNHEGHKFLKQFIIFIIDMVICLPSIVHFAHFLDIPLICNCFSPFSIKFKLKLVFNLVLIDIKSLPNKVVPHIFDDQLSLAFFVLLLVHHFLPFKHGVFTQSQSKQLSMFVGFLLSQGADRLCFCLILFVDIGYFLLHIVTFHLHLHHDLLLFGLSLLC